MYKRQIYIGDIKDGGYNEGHDKGRLALEAEGIACEYKENVPESTAEVETAISELIDLGCNVIYATSFGHMEGTLNMANAHPDVYFEMCIRDRRNAEGAEAAGAAGQSDAAGFGSPGEHA